MFVEKLLLTLLILISRNDMELLSSISDVNLILGCWPQCYLYQLLPLTLVILNKNDYISRMKVILNDSSKFQKLSIDQNKVLNHIVYMENRIIDVLKKLKNKKIISENKY